MGTFTVPLQVADPEGRHYETVEAMVDSEATDTALPGSIDASMVASSAEVCRSNEDQPSTRSERHASPTPSIALLNRTLGPSPAPRMLTPYEIELLRQTKVEIDRAAGEIFARKDSTSKK